MTRVPLGRKSRAARSALAAGTREKLPPARLQRLRIEYERVRAEEIRDAAQARLDEIAAAAGHDD